MLGRQVGSNLLRLPIYARIPFRPASFQCQQALTSTARALLCTSQRFYATPGRPRSTVGEPSRPVKRAAKRDAKSKDGPAKEKTQARKKGATAKKKTAPKAAKKPAPKKSKILTEEQKAQALVKKSKAQVADLKKAALSPPVRGSRMTAYNRFSTEKMKGLNLKASGEKLSDVSKRVAAEFKQLGPAEVEHYNHLAHTAAQDANVEYKSWVESRTPEEIQTANRARMKLRRQAPKTGRGRNKWTAIHDERAIRRPISAYLQFNVNRQASGDFRNIPLGERAKLISKEWKALSESEKKKYKDLQSQEQSRYSTEYKDVYNHLPPSYSNGQPQAAAAAG